MGSGQSLVSQAWRDKKDLQEFWTSSQSICLYDHRRSTIEKDLFEQFFKASSEFVNHVWIPSSGSSQSLQVSTKLIGLSKSAILASAQIVNEFLRSTDRDRWALCLPRFHIGGLSIEARSFLSGAEVLDLSELKWNPEQFLKTMEESKISLLSLVPTQVFDLVNLGLRAPISLRAVIVGGGALNPELYLKARELGWPLLPSFGMTEACSQIATAPLESLKSLDYPSLRVLGHLSYQISPEGLLGLKGSSLMTGYWQKVEGETRFSQLHSGKTFWTSDFVQEVSPRDLRPLGRQADFVKVLGEGVHLGQVEERFRKSLDYVLAEKVALGIRENPRRGTDLILLVEARQLSQDQLQKIESSLNRWNKDCLPVERFQELKQVSEFPRAALGKIRRQLL